MPQNEALAAAVAPVAAALVAGAQPRGWYAINRKPETPEEAEVLIYDEIGAWGVDAKTFANDLRGINAATINVRLNTPGGSVFDGTAIHNSLRAHPARVIMYVEGVAASAGSFVMLAGDEIRMADNAYVMIHDASGGVMGCADDMRGYAEILEKIDGNIAMMYSAKTGKPPEHYRDLMNAETWFTAAEAKAEGLVDVVYTAKPAKVPARAASFTTIYNRIPEPVREMWAGKQKQSPAPEDSLRCEPPPAITKENSPMANESTTAAPAQTPAAGSVPNVTQGATITEAENRRREVVNLNAQAIEGYISQGHTAGFTEGRKAELERAKSIAESCPGKPDMALGAILANHSPESVRLAFAASVAAEERAKVDFELKDAEIARWRALAATGGYPGGVPTGVSGAEDDGEPEILDDATAKTRAEREWEQKPSLRKGFTSKDRYVAVRVAEMTGKLKVATASSHN